LPKKHRFNNGNFITLFQEAMTEIAINGNLTKGELQLLFYLIGQANPFGAVNLTLNDLVEDLKENKGNLVRAIKGLVERKIILKKTENGARIKGKLNYYELSLSYDRLNYNLAWKGKVKDYKNVQEKDPEILKEKPKSIGLFNGLGSIEEGFSEQKKIKGVQILD
jgi:DNA-binding transcriptional regulator GbsR (MarR family)